MSEIALTTFFEPLRDANVPREEDPSMAKIDRGAWRFHGLMSVLAIGGALLAIFYEGCHGEGVKALGTGFSVGAVLAVVLDRYVRERLIHKASNDISAYLIGYGLPDPFKLRIREVMRSDLVFCDLTQHYRFDGERLEMETTYRVENYAEKSQDYHQEQRFDAWEFPIVHELACTGAEQYQVADIKTVGSGRTATFVGPTISIRPRKENVKYEFRSRTSIVPTSGTDIIAFSRPVMGVKVFAVPPRGGTFDCASIATPNKPPQEGFWEFDRAFLPGEHLRFNWTFAKDQAASSSSPNPQT